MGERDALVIAGGLIPYFEGRRLDRKDLLIRNGVIEAVLEPGSLPPDVVESTPILDASDAVILPGFVNAHTHSYGMLARHFGSGLPLEPWMMYSWAITGDRSAEEVYLSAYLQGVEALLTGTTTVLDHLGGDVATTGEAARAYQDLGIRAAIAPMISDIPLHKTVGVKEEEWPGGLETGMQMLESPPADVLLQQTRDLHREWDGAASNRISVLLGPSAPQRCTSGLLDGCAQLSSDLGMKVHTHFLETRVQAVDTRAHLDTLEEHGLLSDRLIGAHGVWAENDELRRLAAAGATLVHNPQSNLQLGSGVAELAQWRSAGVNAALGTDGANCGGSMDMVGSMRLATILHRPGLADDERWETPWSVLQMATADGARALGLERAGTVESGAIADLAIFSISGTPYMATDDVLSSFMLSSLHSLAKHVVVDGQVIVRDGCLDKINVKELTGLAREASDAIFHRNRSRIHEVAHAQRDTLVERVRSTIPMREIIPFTRL